MNAESIRANDEAARACQDALSLPGDASASLNGFIKRVLQLLPSVDETLAIVYDIHRLATGPDDAAVADDLGHILAACTSLRAMVAAPGEHLIAGIAPGAELRRQTRHELRTPINVIKGYGEMLLEDAEDGGNAALAPGLRALIGRSEQLMLDIDELFRECAEVGAKPSPPLQAASEENTRPGVAEGRTGRILAVDDTPENLAVLARRLQRLGHTVETTTSGLHALQRLSETPFDLVLLDLMMPEIGGYEVLQQIKASAQTADLPVIMISALNETASVVRCLDAGADDYLPKPFDPTLLRARVDASLERKRLRDIERAYARRLELQADILARELDAARRMQQSILPTRYPLCPSGNSCKRCGGENCSRFAGCPGTRLCASMIPAKEVGGDFYDFVWLDDNRLSFAVADVSGKGVPAALFMSLSLALLRTIGPVSTGPADCLARINRQLCIDNEMSMFVTLFYGIYDTASGFLCYANAGHPSPVLTERDGTPQCLPRVGGVALGIVDDFEFAENRIEIPPGSTLCVYSDGVTEAFNERDEEFGEARLNAVLASANGVSVDGILGRVLGAVEEFANGTAQSDDITCLILRRANSRRHDTLKIVLTNQLPEILRLAEAVEEFFGRHALARQFSFQLNLALDEIVTNIISYGFPNGGRQEIEVDLFLDDNKIVARVLDRGLPFNPLERAAPDTISALDDRKKGGLGVHFAKTLMDEVDYCRQNDRNCLLLVKRFNTRINKDN